MSFYEGLHFTLSGSIARHSGETNKFPLYHGIQYNHEGAFWLRINQGPRHEQTGAYAFITHPDSFFEYGNLPGQTRHHNYICCYGPRVQKYLDGGLLPVNDTDPLIPIPNPERFLSSMTALLALLRKSLPTIPDRAVWMYEDLLLQLKEARSRDGERGGYHDRYFCGLAENIRQNPEMTWDFQAEAQARHMTLNNFRRIFKSLSGVPPQQYLIRCRLQKAASLLCRSATPVAAIGTSVGLPDEYYFSRLFKKHFKFSPTRYRKECSGLEE